MPSELKLSDRAKRFVETDFESVMSIAVGEKKRGAAMAMAIMAGVDHISVPELADRMQSTQQSCFALIGRMIDHHMVEDLGYIGSRKAYRLSRRGRAKARRQTSDE